jgi:hypothetical protein
MFEGEGVSSNESFQALKGGTSLHHSRRLTHFLAIFLASKCFFYFIVYNNKNIKIRSQVKANNKKGAG